MPKHKSTPTTETHVRTMMQSCLLTALRTLRVKNPGQYWTTAQIRNEMADRWRQERVQSYRALEFMYQIGFVEGSTTKMKSATGQSVYGYRISARGMEEHDRFLSIVNEHVLRCNGTILPRAGRAA